MHEACRNWCQLIKDLYPEYFYDSIVCEMGSLNINGSVRDYFTDCTYIGVDVIPGPGVNIVSIFHESLLKKELYDVVTSMNALEHDMYYEKSLKKMVEILKPAGLMFISCSGLWKEHGTINHDANKSGTVKYSEEWSKYYKSLTVNDIVNALEPDENFSVWDCALVERDVRFVGIKR